MKTTKIIMQLALVGLLASTIACDNLFDNSSDEENLDAASELAKTATLDYEVASAEAAGLNGLSGKDAIFSLGFGEFYDPIEETVKDRSDAFAIAPNADSFRGMRARAGKDMGVVTLTYNGTTIELYKIELRGGIFYNFGRRKPGNPRGAMHSDEGEVSDAIPFLPGTAYRFDASGAGDFPALSLEISTPATRLEITSPAEGTTIDGTTDLEVAWQGGGDSQKLLLALVPILDRANFQGPGARFQADGQNSTGPFRGPHRGPGRQFGRNGMQPGKFHDLHFRFVIEENNGSYTISADAIAQVLAIEGVKGVALKVMQLLASEVEQNEAQYALVLRQGDLVKLDMASE
jgi:hypothetical protein